MMAGCESQLSELIPGEFPDSTFQMSVAQQTLIPLLVDVNILQIGRVGAYPRDFLSERLKNRLLQLG